MFGRVTKYFYDRGFGFIRGEDGNTYFIHASKLYGEYIDRGYYVFFKSYADDRSDFNAKNVNVMKYQKEERILRNKGKTTAQRAKNYAR